MADQDLSVSFHDWKSALAAGAAHYFTGKPCKRGHVGHRIAATRACVQCQIERYRVWYEGNRSKKNAADRMWWAANREWAREYYRQHRARYPEKYAAKDSKRRAAKRSAEGYHTHEDVNRIRTLQKDRCAYCRVMLRGGGHIDHIVALSRGGSNWPNNLQVLCVRCNLSKGAKDPIEYVQERGKLL